LSIDVRAGAVAIGEYQSDGQRLDSRRVRDLVDRIAARYTEGSLADELERGRAEYDAGRGRVFEDDDVYATHMAAFLEWFVIERATRGGEPPVAVALQEPHVAPEDEAVLRALAWSHRSVFEIEQREQQGLRLHDLVAGGRWRVSCEVPPHGMEPREVLEARLLPWNGAIALGPVVLFHPREARPHIHALVEQRRAQGRLDGQLTSELAEMRLRFGRFRNIAIDRIYCG
jgi:hypothetical protein